jgi:hypothetical protein
MKETRESRHLSYWSSPVWDKNWEKFAGKSYVKPGKNTRKTGVISGAVKDAQELLSKRDTYFNYDPYPKGHHGYSGYPVIVHPAGLPQSLGELCIELAQDDISSIYTYFAESGQLAGQKRDIQELREKMYHKHTDPEKERRTARAERLIELLRVT